MATAARPDLVSGVSSFAALVAGLLVRLRKQTHSAGSNLRGTIRAWSPAVPNANGAPGAFLWGARIAGRLARTCDSRRWAEVWWLVLYYLGFRNATAILAH